MIRHHSPSNSRALRLLLVVLAALLSTCGIVPRTLPQLVQRGPMLPESEAGPTTSSSPRAVELALEAELALRQGRPMDACSSFEAALEIEPRDATLWARSALAMVQCGKIDAAQQAAASSLSIDPALCEAWQAAWVVLEAGDNTELERLAQNYSDEVCGEAAAGRTSTTLK